MPLKLDPLTAPLAATLVGVIAPSVRLISGVVVALVTVPDTPLAVLTETDVTVPPPAGVTQLPSPRQKVVADAFVPPFKLVTGKLPVTPVVRGKPVALVSTAADGVPMFGVTRVGLVSTTNFVPVPVCEAIEVALPTDVITPVRLAFVITVAANEPVPLPVTSPVRVIV